MTPHDAQRAADLIDELLSESPDGEILIDSHTARLAVQALRSGAPLIPCVFCGELRTEPRNEGDTPPRTHAEGQT